MRHYYRALVRLRIGSDSDTDSVLLNLKPCHKAKNQKAKQAIMHCTTKQYKTRQKNEMQCNAMKTNGITSGGCYNRGCNKLRPQLSMSPSHHALVPPVTILSLQLGIRGHHPAVIAVYLVVLTMKISALNRSTLFTATYLQNMS